VPEAKLLALVGGRAFTVRIEGNESPDDALRDLTGRSGGGAKPTPWAQNDWLDTEEGFRIRRDAVVAYVVGHKEGEWAEAG
jgi:hypothetical protein